MWCDAVLTRRIIFAALIAVSSCIAHAAGVDARLEVEPKEIPWHKAVSFDVIVEAPANTEVEIPNLKDHLGGLQVSGDARIVTEDLPDGRKRVTHRYSLEAPKPEAGKFQPEPVVVNVKGRETISLPTPEITVRDLTPDEEAEAQQMAPALAPLNVKKRVWEYWQFWAGISAAALLGTLAFILYRWYTRARPAPPVRVVPPWESAMARLSALEAKGWREAGKLEAYYVELSAILRHYIEDRFELHAPERTTPEFLSEAGSSGVLNDEHQRSLATFLRYSDRVKFAKFEPTAEDASRNFSEVKKFVEETIPTPAEAAA